jgi:hypothetical protein
MKQSSFSDKLISMRKTIKNPQATKLMTVFSKLTGNKTHLQKLLLTCKEILELETKHVSKKSKTRVKLINLRIYLKALYSKNLQKLSRNINNDKH